MYTPKIKMINLVDIRQNLQPVKDYAIKLYGFMRQEPIIPLSILGTIGTLNFLYSATLFSSNSSEMRNAMIYLLLSVLPTDAYGVTKLGLWLIKKIHKQ